MLSIHLRLGLPSGLFTSGFPTSNLYTFLFSPILATWPAHLILLNSCFVISGNWLVYLQRGKSLKISYIDERYVFYWPLILGFHALMSGHKGEFTVYV
jgi:hypothetical protein